ncbi:MAG TPA: copper ion binding protein [Burkholderiaceae bacterium]
MKLDSAIAVQAPSGSRATPGTLMLPVRGMSCASCVAHVERALAGVPGVAQVAVNLATESASVRSDAGALALAPLIEAVEQAGYHVPTRVLQLRIDGMSCASCVGRVESALLSIAGVVRAEANLANEHASVRIVDGVVSPG